MFYSSIMYIKALKGCSWIMSHKVGLISCIKVPKPTLPKSCPEAETYDCFTAEIE